MRGLVALFAFEGRMDRAPFLLSAMTAIGAQYAAAYFILHGANRPLFWVSPFGQFIGATPAPPLSLAAAMFAALFAGWTLAALSFARARAAGVSGWTSALAALPVVQVLLVVALAVPRSQPPAPTSADQDDDNETTRLQEALRGVLAGSGVCIATVALSTLVFGVYGYALFLGSPFVVGAVTAFLANRPRDVGARATLVIVTLAMIRGGVGLIAFALEGVVCIVMAMPFAIVMGLIGGLFGRGIAIAGKDPIESTVFAVAFLPALLAVERLATHEIAFDSVESVVVAAPPPAVWRAVVEMGPIPEPPSLPFRLGIAYPIDGKILGMGVGALRKGYFSTGIAFERITVWRPGRELRFTVLSDPPMMRELSPYKDVRAPHLLGYYHTGDADFTITPLPGGTSRLSLRTQQTLKLEPSFYWLPFAEWAVRENKLRVLSHFQRRAETLATATR